MFTDAQVAQDPILQYFQFSHLQNDELREMSSYFHDLAGKLIFKAPRNPERTVALRKLLEAKDAAVRSLL